jgi:plastocyanin
VRLTAALLLGLGLAGSLSAAQPRPRGILHGQIDVRLPPPRIDRQPGVAELGDRSRGRGVDRRRSVVYLDPAPQEAFGEVRSRRATLDQRSETFVPHVLAITVGTTVDFPNSDETYHNVFSLSRAKSFDLGRYAAGRSKAITFDRPGIVRVFCDIHSHMNAFVLVFAHRFFATTDAEGRFRIEGVPAGNYTVRVWNEAMPLASRQVTIGPEAEAELNLTLTRE